MKMRSIGMRAVVFLMVVGAGSGFADLARSVGGSWHETNNTWNVGGAFENRVPDSADAVTLLSTENATIDLCEGAVSIKSLIVGRWGGASSTVTLKVRSDLSATGAITIGSNANVGSGAMAISNATVSTANTTLIGKTSSGSLTIDAGGVFQNTSWRLDLGADAIVTVNDGTLSMKNALMMTDGAQLNINGGSEVWILGNDLTQVGDSLMQYIGNGWIYGNGVAGNVAVTYDGSKTIITALSTSISALTRSAGGSWHETLNTWKMTDGNYIYRVPALNDAVTLTSTGNATLDLNEESVAVKSLIVGRWGGVASTVTLKVRNDLSATGVITIGSNANVGSGAMSVSNATVSSTGTTLIGTTSSGSLTISDGGVFQNTTWKISLGADAIVTVDDSILSMNNSLAMIDGAQLNVNGSSEVWILGNDLTQPGDALMQYIESGWISGNDSAGNVAVTYDGSKTIVTADSTQIPDPAHLTIGYEGINIVVTSSDLPSGASNVLEKVSVLNSDMWESVLPYSTGSTSNSWSLPSTGGPEFFRIRSWY